MVLPRHAESFGLVLKELAEVLLVTVAFPKNPISEHIVGDLLSAVPLQRYLCHARSFPDP